MTMQDETTAQAVEPTPEQAAEPTSVPEPTSAPEPVAVAEQPAITPVAEPTAIAPADASSATAAAAPATLEVRQSEFSGNVKRVLEAPPAETSRTYGTAHTVLVRAASTRVAQLLASLVQRPLTEWGLLVEGDEVKGHMDLLDLNTGEKVQALPGHRIGKDGLFANLKNFPQFLGEGDTIERILAGR